jgi:hypothetical protein
VTTDRMGEILMATPATTGDMLIVRTQTQLFALKGSAA